MANKAISELPQAQNVNNQDLFVLEQSGIAKKLTAETFITEQGIIDALAEALDGHGGIQSVTLQSLSGRVRTYLITFSDGSATTFQVYDGTTIERIAKTSTAGLVDTYTIYMSDGTTSFFNVTNGATVELDTTLTQSGKAADAKATGDAVGDLKSHLKTYTGNGVIEYTNESAYFNNSGSTVDISNPIASANVDASVVPCVAGDVFTINGTGGSSARAWSFIDNSGNVLSKAIANTSEVDHVIIAPTDSAYLVINNRKATTPDAVSYYGEYLVNTVGTIKTEIGSIGSYLTGKNILNQDGTVVSGKYINYTNGNVATNADYFYIDDYFPIEPSTTYVPSMTLKSDGTQTTGILTFLVFYDINKGYISGYENLGTAFTTPSNAKYFRWSAPNTQKSTYNFQIEKGSTKSVYVSYHNFYVPNHAMAKFFVVDKNGSGDYTTVTQAVNMADSGDIVFVRNGVYDNEEVSAFGKKITIVGESKNGVIIKNGLNTYSRPPIEFSAGCLKNLTVLAYDGGGASLDDNGWKSYGIHIDNSSSASEHLLIENCNIESEISAGCGVGLWAGETIEFINCNLAGVGNKGGLFCHDNASAGTAGAGKLICHNCTFSNPLTNMFGLQLRSYNMADTAITAEFINCSANPRPVFVTTNGEVSKISLLEHWTVSPLAFGNKYISLEQ